MPPIIATEGVSVGYDGKAVGTAGDVNGDTYDDVIVGAYAYDNGENAEAQLT